MTSKIMKKYTLTKTALIAIIFVHLCDLCYSQNYKWANSIGNTTTDKSYDITTDGSGNVYITGEFSGTADFDPGTGTADLISNGSADIFFAKYDSSGNYLWAKNIGSSSFDDRSSGIITDSIGNVYITGAFRGTADFDPGAGTTNLTPIGWYDIFIAKYDSSGNYIWAKNVGSTNWDESFDIASDAIGNVYITGFFQDTADFDPGAGTTNLASVGNQDIFITKYDNSGNFLWAKNIGSASYDYGYSITTDAWSNVYITGYFYDTADFDPGPGIANLISVDFKDIFFAKYDSSGNYIWAKSIGGSSDDVGYSIATDVTGNVYITGSFQLTADFDPGVGTENLTFISLPDIFFAKYDSSGNYIWARQLGTSDYDMGYSITTDEESNVYIAGYFSNTIDFDPGSGTANLSVVAGQDIFFAKYDSNANYIWAKSIGSTSDDIGYSITTNSSGNVYVTGWYQGTADFDPGASTVNLSPAGVEDIFFAKYGPCNTKSSFTQTATTICKGDSVSFINTSTGATTYQWLEDTTAFSTSLNTSRTFNTADIYSIKLIVAKGGCYDTAEIMITVHPTYNIIDTTIAICTGDSISIYGTFRSDAATYYDSYTTINACDSVHSTVLTVNPSYSITDSAIAICNGDSILIYGKFRSDAGIYYDSLTAVGGCDSVHSTILTVNPTYSYSTPDDSICNGDSIMIFGIYRTAAGTYYDNLNTINGCDSITSTTLIVNSTYSSSSPDETICDGDSAMIFGVYRKTAGTYFNNLTTVNGCDSIFATTLIVNPLPSKPTINQSGNDLSSSSATAYEWYYYDTLIVGATSQFYTVTKSGFYCVMITDVNGCSSKSDPFSITISSIEEIESISGLNVYPNPNAGEFIIEIFVMNEVKELEIKIVNILGQDLYHEQLKQFTGKYHREIDFNDHAIGVYQLQIKTNNTIVNKKIILE